MRQKREWYIGATYHIVVRGNHKEKIYKTEQDYRTFLELLEKLTKRYNCKLHEYCLMTNHYHLLLETGDKKISLFMKSLNQLYTQYFNKKYDLEGTGHLFQGRYKAYLIEDDSYFLQVRYYIQQNPVKAKLVACAEDYPWSSVGKFKM